MQLSTKLFRTDMEKYVPPISTKCIDEPVLPIKMSKETQFMDTTEKNAYMEAMKSGEEVRRYVRIQVIGKYGVGKSSLVRRLLGQQNIENGKSTDGIDIVKRCQIKTDEGRWIVDEYETERKDRIRRILQAADTKRKEIVPDSYHLSYKNELIMERQQDNQVNSEELITKDESKQINILSKYDNETSGNVNNALKIDTVKQQLIKADLNEEITPLEKTEKEIPLSKDTLISRDSRHQIPNPIDPKINDEMRQKIIDKMDVILSEVKKEKEQMRYDALVECGIWDFAGQKDYIVTHQTFLTPHAIYLLVANINEEIKAEDDDENFDHIGEYIDFWFDSIHSFCNDPSSRGKLNPPMLMVFTHTDACEKVEEKKKDYENKSGWIIGSQQKGNHCRGIHFISNIQSDEEDINKLKSKILDIAGEMEYFEEKLPTNWIQLENALDVFKDTKTNILSWENIEELARKSLGEEKEQLTAFLTFQHKIGNIVFFEDIKDYIILQPSWLVKCFRCLVCDDNPDKRNIGLLAPTEWKELTETGKLSDEMIDQLFKKEPTLDFEKYKEHLLSVMEKFDIIIKPQLIDNISGNCQISTSYYMPCMIRNQATSVKDIETKFTGAIETSPWLTFEFTFLPLAYFNHVLFYYIRTYVVCEDNDSQKAIYGGKAVFFLDKSRVGRLVICFSKNAISLQIWKWDSVKDDLYQNVLKELYFKLKDLNSKFRQKTSYTIKAKCSKGDYSKRSGRMSYEQLTDRCKKGKYFCDEHNEMHNKDSIETIWLKNADMIDRDLHSKTNIAEEDELSPENMIIDEKTDNTTQHIHDDIIAELMEDQTAHLKSIEKNHPVNMTVDKVNCEIILNGKPDEVIYAEQEVTETLREFNQQIKDEAAFIKDHVQWYLKEMDGGRSTLIEYPDIINMHLEHAYNGVSGKSEVEFKIMGDEYVIVLEEMTEYLKTDKTIKTEVVRKEKVKEDRVELPPEWDEQGSENVKLVTLLNSSPEYKSVEQKFLASVFSGRPEWVKQFNKQTFKVTKIERVQNLGLYQMYAAKKALMDKQNPPGRKNEKELWHGTSYNTVVSINLYGFNKSYYQNNRKDAYWGEGVYFSADASYSARGLLSEPSASGEHNMYMCKVLTGVSCPGKRGMRVLPGRRDGTLLYFDSATDTNYTPTVEYVIFNDTQAYPQYCIKFKY